MSTELCVVGAWGLFDHFLAMEKYPQEGDTICTLPDQVYPETVFYGDCSGNIAAVAAKLGTKVRLVSVVGNDFVSSGYEKHMKALSVDLDGITVIPDSPSGHNYNCFAPNGDGFCISKQGAAAAQDQSMVKEEWFRDVQYTVICEAFSEYSLQAARFAQKSGGRVALSGMVGDRNPLLWEFLDVADILFINRSEYHRLLQLAGENEIFTKYGLERIYLTCGAEGAKVLTKDSESIVPAVRGKGVKDPTGAGDAFVAGTVSALLRGWIPDEAAKVGASSSSFIIEEFGCQTNLPTWEEATQRIQTTGGAIHSDESN